MGGNHMKFLSKELNYWSYYIGANHIEFIYIYICTLYIYTPNMVTKIIRFLKSNPVKCLVRGM